MAEAMQALADAIPDRPANTVTMAEIRAHTGWGEKQAYRKVRELIRSGAARAVRVRSTDVRGVTIPITAYQLVK